MRSLLPLLFLLLACRDSADAAAQGGPPADDPASLRIELDRSACFGSCPDYRLIVEGTGWVTYQGRGSVLVPGTFRRRVDPAAVAALARRFEAAGFFRLHDSYRLEASDGPTHTLTLAMSGRTKRVVDYFGAEAGMPAAVTELERLVDELGGSRRWIEGDDDTVDELRAQGWNFASPLAAAVMVQAAARGKTVIVRELHEAGVLATARVGEVTALEAAARSGRFETFQMLASAGALAAADAGQQARLAAAAVATGNARILAALMPFRFDVNAGPRPLLNEAMGIRCDDVPECERPAVIRLLLAGGADPDRADEHGGTAIHYAETVAEARLLVAAGAEVNARDVEGQTAAMVMYQDWEDLVLYFLDAGTDPGIRSVHGETLLDKARQNRWQRVVARLSAR